MTEFTRKIQVVGNRSYAVSLPKKWVIKNNLEKKEVNITEYKGNLIISSKKISKNTSSKDIIIENLQLIPSILLLCYTRGISEVKLIFKKKEDYLSAKPIVLEILSHLEGFKIINDNNNNNILIRESYNQASISIQDLAKRSVIILNNMIDCILSNNNKTKQILENESDSLYHFSKRILYNYVNFSSIQIDIEEIFLWRLIFKKLENIGDILEKINKKHYTKENIQDIINNLNDYIILKKHLTISEIEKIKEKEFKNLNNNKIKDLVIDILNNLLLINLNKTYFSD
jgi:phosphate uptake regulator